MSINNNRIINFRYNPGDYTLGISEQKENIKNIIKIRQVEDGVKFINDGKPVDSRVMYKLSLDIEDYLYILRLDHLTKSHTKRVFKNWSIVAKYIIYNGYTYSSYNKLFALIITQYFIYRFVHDESHENAQKVVLKNFKIDKQYDQSTQSKYMDKINCIFEGIGYAIKQKEKYIIRDNGIDDYFHYSIYDNYLSFNRMYISKLIMGINDNFMLNSRSITKYFIN